LKRTMAGAGRASRGGKIKRAGTGAVSVNHHSRLRGHRSDLHWEHSITKAPEVTKKEGSSQESQIVSSKRGKRQYGEDLAKVKSVSKKFKQREARAKKSTIPSWGACREG